MKNHSNEKEIIIKNSSSWTNMVGKLQSQQHITSGDVFDIRPTVCNIEADRPGYNARKINPFTRWGNMVVALDSPFSAESKVHYTFSELLDEQAKHDYKCLEASLPSFDQLKVLVQQLTWIAYYVELYTQHNEIDKSPHITIQVHQRANETDQLNHFIKYLPLFYQHFVSLNNEENDKRVQIIKNNVVVTLHLKYGYDIDGDLKKEDYHITEIPVPDSDAYLSFSMSIGYDPDIAPSDVVYPDNFYCLNTETNTLQDYPAYRGEPHIPVVNDFIEQSKAVDFKEKFSELAAQWVAILKSNHFEPEGKDVIRHDSNHIDATLLCQLSTFRTGSVAKLVDIWNPDPQGEHPINSWKVGF